MVGIKFPFLKRVTTFIRAEQATDGQAPIGRWRRYLLRSFTLLLQEIRHRHLYLNGKHHRK